MAYDPSEQIPEADSYEQIPLDRPLNDNEHGLVDSWLIRRAQRCDHRSL